MSVLRYFPVALGLALGATPATAKDDWSGHVWVLAQPAFETTDAYSRDDEFVDKSEYQVFGWATSPDVLPDEPVILKVGATSSPHLFGQIPAKSGLIAQIQLGNRLLYPDRLNPEIFGGDLHPRKRVNYYAGLTHSQRYTGLFDSKSGHADIANLGAEFADLESMWCSRDDEAVPVEAGKSKCTGGAAKAGLSYSLSLNASRTWASNPAGDNKNLEAIGRVEGPPLAGVARPVAAISVDRTFYDSALTPTGETRRDWTTNLFAGLDLAPIVQVPHLLTQVGVERTWHDSNDPTYDVDDTRYFLRATYLFNF